MSPGDHHLLTPTEVAGLFGVDPKTVSRWADAGKISSTRTMGGHRRFHASEIHRLLSIAEEPDVIGHQSPPSPERQDSD